MDIAVWARSPKLKRKQRARLKVWVGHVVTKKGLYANINARKKKGISKAAKTAKKKKK